MKIRKCKVKILEKADKVTVGIFMLYFFRTRLNDAYIINVLFPKSAGHLSVVQSFFLKKYLVTLRVFYLARDFFPYFGGKRRHAFYSKEHYAVSSPLQS